MNKCGKGCMPECEYFTTGGCISPFNCMYKIETGYINSATSTPDSLTELLIEFDEMGFAPTTLCPNPEEYAIGWREKVRKEIERLKSENAELKEGYIKEIYGEILPLYVDGYDVEIKSIEAIADPADSTGMNIKVFVAAYCTYLNYGEDRRRSTDKLYVIMASTNKGKDWDVCRDRNRCVIVEETWREARKTMERMYRMQWEEADMFGLAHIPRKYFKIVEFSPTEVEINAKKDKTQS